MTELERLAYDVRVAIRLLRRRRERYRHALAALLGGDGVGVLPRSPSALGDGVMDVVALRAGAQMVGIHATRDITRVHDNQALRDWTVMQLKREAVRGDARSVLSRKIDVATGGPFRASEDPAPVGLLLDTRPEAIYSAVSLTTTAEQPDARRPPSRFRFLLNFADRKGIRTIIIGITRNRPIIAAVEKLCGAHLRNPRSFRDGLDRHVRELRELERKPE